MQKGAKKSDSLAYEGNGPVPRAARWLRALPASVAELTLDIEGDDGNDLTLARWLGDDLRAPSVATQAYEYVLQQVEQSGRTCNGRLVALDAHGKRIASRPLIIQSEEGPTIRGDGSMRDLVVQTQVHLQKVMDLFTRNQVATFQVLHKQADSNAAYVEELRKIVRRLDSENSRMREQLVMAANLVDDDESGEQIVKMLQLLVDHQKQKAAATPDGAPASMMAALKPYAGQLMAIAETLAKDS